MSVFLLHYWILNLSWNYLINLLNVSLNQQIAANWACVKFLDSAYHPLPSHHRPINTAHRNSSEANGHHAMTSLSTRSGVVMSAGQQGSVQSRAAYDRRVKESNGLKCKLISEIGYFWNVTLLSPISHLRNCTMIVVCILVCSYVL